MSRHHKEWLGIPDLPESQAAAQTDNKEISLGNLHLVSQWTSKFYLVPFQANCFSQAISG